MEKIFFEHRILQVSLPIPLFDPAHRLDDRGGKRLAHRCSLVRPRSIGSRGKNIWARLHDKQKVLAARKRECHASDLVRPRVTGKNEFSS